MFLPAQARYLMLRSRKLMLFQRGRVLSRDCEDFAVTLFSALANGGHHFDSELYNPNPNPNPKLCCAWDDLGLLCGAHVRKFAFAGKSTLALDKIAVVILNPSSSPPSNMFTYYCMPPG